MSKEKKILLHYERDYREWEEVEITLVEEGESPEIHAKWYNRFFAVLIDGEKVDTLIRDPSHKTHQTHGRIRYDNSPRVRFKAQDSGIFFVDTRNEAIGDILSKRGMTQDRHSVHLPGRPDWWRSCSLCKDE